MTTLQELTDTFVRLEQKRDAAAAARSDQINQNFATEEKLAQLRADRAELAVRAELEPDAQHGPTLDKLARDIEAAERTLIAGRESMRRMEVDEATLSQARVRLGEELKLAQAADRRERIGLTLDEIERVGVDFVTQIQALDPIVESLERLHAELTELVFSCVQEELPGSDPETTSPGFGGNALGTAQNTMQAVTSAAGHALFLTRLNRGVVNMEPWIIATRNLNVEADTAPEDIVRIGMQQRRAALESRLESVAKRRDKAAAERAEATSAGIAKAAGVRL